MAEAAISNIERTGSIHVEMITTTSTSGSFLRAAYTSMLLTRVVDNYALRLHKQGQIGFVASCRGHEAAQVGSALCIEVGKDFTLPYYRDLGVVLNVGMTPYEVFRTYLQAYRQWVHDSSNRAETRPATLHWGYHKHNIVTGPAPVATQILHAAGIAFASKLRKASAVTVAFCGDGATAEPDFLEGVTFAVLHQLPVVFVCEQDCSDIEQASVRGVSLPGGLAHHLIDGSDVLVVYTAMHAAMQHAREGHGPVLLEMKVSRSISQEQGDPLVRCQRLMEEQGIWDERWAAELQARLSKEVEQASQDALRDVPETDGM
jgi:2-oxoisovalerate dehydrogenase E1 component alpha subunit